ncbi:MAG: hypothetical protein AMXMBFR47_32750 [Planctomycetota bacterium]
MSLFDRFTLCLFTLTLVATANADSWPMKQREMAHTGRAGFTVPAERMNDTFFNFLAWQTRSPGSPNEGNFDSGSAVFFDGAGPGGADLLVAGYHWPKGVQGMDRRTGERFWYGNPRGGETIGTSTPAFSLDGSTIYVVNDATASQAWPAGHPLMAFAAATGPGNYWHNGDDFFPGHLSAHAPTIAPDGRIFLYDWVDRPYAGTDYGNAIRETWAAAAQTGCGLSDPSLYDDNGVLRVVSAGRWGVVASFDGVTGDLYWSVPTPTIDATPTIDPAGGNIYVAAGSDSIWVVGLSKTGLPLWWNAAELVYEHVPGFNSAQRAQAGGCLSHDGSTYYFQTNSSDGDGRLYAINTWDGTVKWSYATGSSGWEMVSSSPIVTPNGVIIVGNNNGGVYYALRDDGAAATLLDSFAVAAGAPARASAALSEDGLLYLPLRTTWAVGNGNGDVPNFATENVYTAFNLNADATTILPPPANQSARALNHAVSLRWRPIVDTTGQFSHYAVYRSTAPFDSVEGMTPIATIPGVNSSTYTDATALNGVSYYYAVTSVAIGGGEQTTIDSIGPRTPRSESDLQVLRIRRTPEFPRYDPIYTYYSITEPSGFGPYVFSAATGLGSGQTPQTQRWPNVGDAVTYTATIRNRGTNPWTTSVTATWRVDGVVVSTQTLPLSLQPAGTATTSIVRTWDNQLHDISVAISAADSRSANNSLTVNSKSVGFLTYVDASYVEDFRENTENYPQAYTDDMFDWLNHHMARFNQMFAAAGTAKRVHYNVLEMLEDDAADPNVPRINYAIFPFRYHATDSDARLPGYYHAGEDIDFGLLHEMGHQLGLIDIYRLDISADRNEVSHTGYNAVPCLMHGVSTFLSENSANAMTHWLHTAQGYFGQYLYDMPETIRVRFLDGSGDPLAGATVRLYQKCERPGLGEVITTQIKAQGVTDANGVWTLPNVPINPALAPTTPAGDTLRDNPFGYLAVVGTNSVLLLAVEANDQVDYAWFDALEANNAYRAGQTGEYTFTRQVSIGSGVQYFPPEDMAEQNAADWARWAQDGTIDLFDDAARRQVGTASVRIEATGGFDNYVRYPRQTLAKWDLSRLRNLRVRFYSENPNFSYQSQSPWVRLGHHQDGYFEWRPTFDILNQAENQWVEFVVPVNGNATWQRTTTGTPSLEEINYLELHADTWGAGFTLWMDGVTFDPPPLVGDIDNDGDVDLQDLATLLGGFGTADGATLAGGDLDGDGDVDISDLTLMLSSYGRSAP